MVCIESGWVLSCDCAGHCQIYTAVRLTADGVRVEEDGVGVLVGVRVEEDVGVAVGVRVEEGVGVPVV